MGCGKIPHQSRQLLLHCSTSGIHALGRSGSRRFHALELALPRFLPEQKPNSAAGPEGGRQGWGPCNTRRLPSDPSMCPLARCTDSRSRLKRINPQGLGRWAASSQRGQTQDAPDAQCRAQRLPFALSRVRSKNPLFHLPNLLIQAAPDVELGQHRQAHARSVKACSSLLRTAVSPENVEILYRIALLTPKIHETILEKTSIYIFGTEIA